MADLDALSPLLTPDFANSLRRLEELASNERLVFLFGAGTSYCEDMPLMADLTESIASSASTDSASKELLRAVEATFGKGVGNIEDYLSEIGDHIAVLERRDSRLGKASKLQIGGTEYGATALRGCLETLKAAIAREIEDCPIPNNLEHHRKFIRAIHQAKRPGKRLPRVVDYLLLNYDTLIEEALDLEKIPYADGLQGGSSGWWNPMSAFQAGNIGARVLKLHGSIDWRLGDGDPMPRRASSRLQTHLKFGEKVLIWPASTKYAESQRDPFAQLMSRARVSITPAEGEEAVLIICGYGFGDEHINAEIESAMRSTNGRLTVAVLTSELEPNSALANWRDDLTLSPNLLVFAKHGFFHGDTEIKSADELPWWKFEVLARLLAGER